MPNWLKSRSQRNRSHKVSSVDPPTASLLPSTHSGSPVTDLAAANDGNIGNLSGSSAQGTRPLSTDRLSDNRHNMIQQAIVSAFRQQPEKGKSLVPTVDRSVTDKQQREKEEEEQTQLQMQTQSDDIRDLIAVMRLDPMCREWLDQDRNEEIIRAAFEYSTKNTFEQFKEDFEGFETLVFHSLNRGVREGSNARPADRLATLDSFLKDVVTANEGEGEGEATDE